MKIRNLYRRSVTAVFFAAITLFLVLFNPLTVHLFVWLVALLCSVEYITIRSAGRYTSPVVWLFAILAGPLVPLLNYFGWLSFSPVVPLLVLSVIYQLYLAGRLFFNYDYGHKNLFVVLTAFLYLGLPMTLMNQFMLTYDPNNLVLNILLLIWASDTFAYLTGSLIGRTKLLERISPGKTVEGALGGLFFTLLAARALYEWQSLGSLGFHLGLALIIWFFGLIGDLVESHLKRRHGIKDSGKLLPGHGGFLDRFDSLVYVIPFVLLYLSLYQ